MKKIFVLLLLLVLGLADAYAQEPEKTKQQLKKEKEDRKKWKEKMSKVEPLQYRDMLKEIDELSGENEALKRQNANMQRDRNDKDLLLMELKAKRDSLLSAKPVAKERNEIDMSYQNGYSKGIIFRVQVGAYRNIDLSKFKDNNKNFTVTQEGDVFKYTLGYFRNPKEAYLFKRYLAKIGVPSPWVVAYKDGYRMSENIREILKSVGVPEAELNTGIYDQ